MFLLKIRMLKKDKQRKTTTTKRQKEEINKIRMLKPRCDGIRRWGLWEVSRCQGWGPRNGLEPLWEEARELAHSLTTTRGHSRKTAACKPESRPRSQPGQHLDLGPPTSTAGRNKCCLSHPICGTLL